ncbi:hypothetical protein ACN27F_31005 [Solwaraspora sp. WMMB335]|uniref:hypothetical protein n=1 Tax=Solwaraspora sp. WMMB335 TaxID=3404118 RepID=UPI003B92EEC8
MPIVAWPRRRRDTARAVRRPAFASRGGTPLDLLVPPAYERPEHQLDADRARVRELIGSLQQGALDAGSRQVLANLINELGEQSLAELDVARDERRAVGRVLLGMAAEELVRRWERLKSAAVRASHAETALALAFEELTGHSPADRVDAQPNPFSAEARRSAIGPIDLGLHGPDVNGGIGRANGRAGRPAGRRTDQRTDQRTDEME